MGHETLPKYKVGKISKLLFNATICFILLGAGKEQIIFKSASLAEIILQEIGYAKSHD